MDAGTFLINRYVDEDKNYFRRFFIMSNTYNCIRVSDRFCKFIFLSRTCSASDYGREVKVCDPGHSR